MRDSPVARRERILGSLRREGTLRVTELARAMSVSEVTMRRDVEFLERKGHLHREHGSISLPIGLTVNSANRNLLIGLVVPTAYYYFAPIIARIQGSAAAVGAKLAVRISGYGPGQDRLQAQQLVSRGAHGVILAPLGMREEDFDYDWIAELPVPAVLLERKAQRNSYAFGVDAVYTDHKYGVRLALDELRRAGRENCMLAVRNDSPTGRTIRQGWEDETLTFPKAAGYDIVYTCSEATNPEGFEECFRKILEAVRTKQVNGIVIHNDSDAVVLVQRLEAEGVRIPEELAVVSYDNEVADLADVSLTSISPEKQVLGSAAVDLLMDRIQDPSGQAKHLSLLPRLVRRNSTQLTNPAVVSDVVR